MIGNGLLPIGAMNDVYEVGIDTPSGFSHRCWAASKHSGDSSLSPQDPEKQGRQDRVEQGYDWVRVRVKKG